MMWTLTFINTWWPRMTLGSVWRYRDFMTRKPNNSHLTLRLKPGMDEVMLREYGTDAVTFQEIWLEEVYRDVLHHKPSAKTIIDLGAHIGLTSLYLVRHLPGSRVFAVEPHPGNYALLKQNLKLLIKENRCQVMQAAAWHTASGLDCEMDREGHYSAVQR